MSREKDAEKIKLLKMERELSKMKEEVALLEGRLSSLQGDARKEAEKLLKEKKIELAVLRNGIAREKIKISKMD